MIFPILIGIVSFLLLASLSFYVFGDNKIIIV